jgi:hypothetical protein
MRKVFTLFLAVVLLLTFTACTSNVPGGPTGNLEGSLEEILAKIYETAEVSDSFKEFIADGLYTQEITEEWSEYHLGKTGIEYEEAIASEPMMQPSAYSLCLIRAKAGSDVEALKTEIKASVNPMKWVCVGVDPQNIVVDNIGDIVILIMSDYEAVALHEAFLALK